jgi:hypothetical protein
MTTIFVNSLLYIWPISALIYRPTGNVPIVAIVAWLYGVNVTPIAPVTIWTSPISVLTLASLA